jgi:ubiquinone/menaquinone biosynthesis C-methylase UbiE
MGAGSGRLTSILAPFVKSILAIDSSAEMLSMIEEKLNDDINLNYQTQVADHRKIPVETKVLT